MNVRLYRESDRAQVVALWKTALPDDAPHNEPSAVLSAKLEVDRLIFVAEHENILAGALMAGYDGHRGWLYSVAVDASMRRKGIGSELVRHALAELQARGCVKVNLQVRGTNSIVVSFYESLGFQIEERISMGKLLLPAVSQKERPHG